MKKQCKLKKIPYRFYSNDFFLCIRKKKKKKKKEKEIRIYIIIFPNLMIIYYS